MIPVIVGVVALAAGVVVGFLIRANIAKSSANTLEAQARQKSIEADEKLVKADQEAAAVLRRANEDAKSEAAQVRRDAEDDVKSRRDEIARLERRISESEEDLRERTRKLDQRGAELDERDEILHDARMQLEKAADQHRTQLERVAGMTSSEAREELVAHVVDDAKRAAMAQVREIEQRGPRGGRGAGPQDRRRSRSSGSRPSRPPSPSVSVLHLPSDDMKGRIIGREGRNIRAFESITGVNLIIDDTPEAVLLSCFDPVRREVGRLTLEKLVLDGRIHPHADRGGLRAVARPRSSELCLRAGEDAAGRGRHHRHAPGAGRRCSAGCATAPRYGQNVLKHLVESAHIAGDHGRRARARPRRSLKRGAFLHDIGKALTHEVEGSHALIGAEIARRLRRARGRRARASRRTTTRSSSAPSRRCSPRPPTRSAAAGPGRGASRWRPT